MNAISTLTILPKTKSGIDAYVAAVKEDILSGYINPLESAIMLKSFDEIIEALRSDVDIKRYIEDEADKYTEKKISFAGCTIAKSDRTNYDFANCDDSVLNDMLMRKTQLDLEIKGRTAWLKTLKEQTPDVNTGEIINPPATNKTTIISITIAKQ